MRTPSSPAAFVTAAHGFFRSARGAAVLHAGDDVRVAFEAWQACENLHCRRAQIDRLPARLAVGQKENAALEIDVLPFGV